MFNLPSVLQYTNLSQFTSQSYPSPQLADQGKCNCNHHYRTYYSEVVSVYVATGGAAVRIVRNLQKQSGQGIHQ